MSTRAQSNLQTTITILHILIDTHYILYIVNIITEMINRHKYDTVFYIVFFSFPLVCTLSFLVHHNTVCVSDRHSCFLLGHISHCSLATAHRLSSMRLSPMKPLPIIDDQPPPPLCNYGIQTVRKEIWSKIATSAFG